MIQLKSPARAGEQGFTLVELAIVMIIIGLLIGGVLKGQELIGNARVASTVSQIKAFETATNTFRDMYDAIPGDFSTASTRLPTCTVANCNNGNGNNRVSGAGAAGLTPAAANAASTEAVYFWGHLAASKLVSGVDGSTTLEFGKMAPKSELSGGYSVGYANLIADMTGRYGTQFVAGHYLSMKNTLNVGVGASNANASLTPSEAGRIDRKIDDGRPGFGVVVAAGPAASNAAGALTCANDINTYAERVESKQCQLYIRIMN